MQGIGNRPSAPNLIPSVPYLQFFPGKGQAHPASGASSLGAQPSVGSNQTLGASYQVKRSGLILSCSASLAGLLQFPTSVTVDPSLYCCFIRI